MNMMISQMVEWEVRLQKASEKNLNQIDDRYSSIHPLDVFKTVSGWFRRASVSPACQAAEGGTTLTANGCHS